MQFLIIINGELSYLIIDQVFLNQSVIEPVPIASGENYDLLTTKLQNIDDYLEKLKVEATEKYFPHNDFQKAIGKMLLLILIVQKGLEKLVKDHQGIRILFLP